VHLMMFHNSICFFNQVLKVYRSSQFWKNIKYKHAIVFLPQRKLCNNLEKCVFLQPMRNVLYCPLSLNFVFTKLITVALNVLCDIFIIYNM
jgi:hypothetical protein